MFFPGTCGHHRTASATGPRKAPATTRLQRRPAWCRTFARSGRDAEHPGRAEGDSIAADAHRLATPTMFTGAPVNAPHPSNERVSVTALRKFAGDSSFMHPQPLPSRGPSQSRTIAFGFLNGSGRSNTKTATENVAVLAPTPSAVMSTAAMAKPREPLSVRAVKRRSCRRIAQCTAKALGTTSVTAATIAPMRPRFARSR
jgi:hypothetical protein